ncbi:branched-chain alpha-ketoacid dehydrogenase [Chlamydoabsidia padenii]|nr:branched-chain alpha-ketoacid dehydrogenase [Chlamydoabsidia padenii]
MMIRRFGNYSQKSSWIWRQNYNFHRHHSRPLCATFTTITKTILPNNEPLTAKPPESTKADAPYHFYQNKVLEPYLKQTIHANTLRQYIVFGRHITSDRLVTSANWVRNELLVRLAHRIRDFQQLPFIVGTNPNIEYSYRLYWGAFEALRKTPTIKTIPDNEAFCDLLNNLFKDGQQVLPRMAVGISECASHFTPHDNVLDRFLNRMMQARISRRLLADQHRALTKACRSSSNGKQHGNQVGIFNTECSAQAMLDQALALVTKQYPTSSLPPVHVQIPDGDILFAYIPDQLEHVLYELLHNATKYTLQQQSTTLPPIQVTICANKTDVFFRVSDQAGGIMLSKYERLWSYQERANRGDFTDFKHVPKMPVTMTDRFEQQQQQINHAQTNVSLGIGLLMSKVYAEYWGGELQVISLDGYGTDAYVRIPRTGLLTENIGIDESTSSQPSSSLSKKHHLAAAQKTNKHHQHHHRIKHVGPAHNQKGWVLSSIITS